MNTANIEAQFLARTGQTDDAERKAQDPLARDIDELDVDKLLKNAGAAIAGPKCSDARGGKDAPTLSSTASMSEAGRARSEVPLVAIGPPGYEHDGAWKAPSLSPVLDAVERAKAKPVTADDLVNRVIAEARKVCRDFAEVEASGADNETKYALFQGVAGLQGALAALDRKRG